MPANYGVVSHHITVMLQQIQRSWSVLDLFCEEVSELGLRKDVHSSVKTIITVQSAPSSSLGKR